MDFLKYVFYTYHIIIKTYNYENLQKIIYGGVYLQRKGL
jgi:hypothetical protein